MPRGGDDIEDLEDLLLEEVSSENEIELTILKSKVKEWRRTSDGVLHHPTEPARSYPDGSREWFLHGERGRLEHGPTVILSDGTVEYHQNDLLHNTEGPAHIIPGLVKEWWYEGMPHRDGNLPSVTYQHPEDAEDQGLPYKAYHIHGIRKRTDRGPCEIWADGTLLFWEEYNSELLCNVYYCESPDGTCELYLEHESEGLPAGNSFIVASTRIGGDIDVSKKIIQEKLEDIAPDFVAEQGDNILPYFEKMLRNCMAETRLRWARDE